MRRPMLAKADARPLHLGIRAWVLVVSLAAALAVLLDLDELELGLS